MTLGLLALISFTATLLLSLALPVVVRPLLSKLGVMDVPNERSSHAKPVLRGLGLAVLFAMFAVGGACAVWIATSQNADMPATQWQFLLVVVLGTFCAGLLGFSEDLKGVSVPVRSALLLVIAATTSVMLLWLARGAAATFAWHQGLDIRALPIWMLVALAIYGVLFISSYINVANFMDGLNGISGLHGVIAGLAFAASGALSGQAWLLVAGCVLAAGFGGFLPWNLTKPGAFLGDVGSYLLGGAVSVTSFAALLAGIPVLAAIGPMVIYFGDVGVTLVKRVRAGYKWDEPHKEHAYQRLNQLGMSHLAASSINAAFTLAASLLGLASFFLAPIWWLLLLVLGLALVVVYQLLPRLLAPRVSSSAN